MLLASVSKQVAFLCLKQIPLDSYEMVTLIGYPPGGVVNKSTIAPDGYDLMKSGRLQALLCSTRNEYSKAMEDVEILKIEFIKALWGESFISKDFLITMVSEAEEKCAVLQEQADAAQIAYNEGQTMLASLLIRMSSFCFLVQLADYTLNYK